MRTTIFDTPVVNTLMRGLSLAALKLFGWEIAGPRPGAAKYVVIAAPHTSNWDLPVMLAAAFALQVKAFWLGKHTLFRGPLGPFFRWLGGIPIDRRAVHNVVDQSIELFRQNEQFVLAIAPEGTRKKVGAWKTGFYYIAHGAGVPVAMGFIDFKRKLTGFGPTILPSGNLEADLQKIREFYSGITGKYPDQTGSV